MEHDKKQNRNKLCETGRREGKYEDKENMIKVREQMNEARQVSYR